MSAPYWGHLPAPTAGQPRAHRPSDDHQVLPPERRQSLDAPAPGRPAANRISVQTTKSDAPTDSTPSPFVSPAASSFHPHDGLAPRPPSLPYAAIQYPPELLENRRRRRSRNQEQDDEYAAALAGSPPPAAPDAPRAPPAPASSRHPPASGRLPSAHPAPHQGASRPDMQTDDYSGPSTPAGPQTLDEAAVPRPQRQYTDPSLGRNSSAPNSRVRRTSAAEQSLQRSARRASAQPSTDRPRMFANDRSPLQRLELTLDSISKEDKRARVEAAERAAREKAAAAAAANGAVQHDEKSPQAQPAPSREQRLPAPTGDAATAPVTPTWPPATSAPHDGPGPLAHDTPDAPSTRAAAPESQIPVSSGQSSGIPRRNLSFRERAERNDAKRPSSLAGGAARDASPATSNGRGRAPRSGGNKLKKYSPTEPWPSRVSEPDEIYDAGYTEAHSPRHIAGGWAPVSYGTPRTGTSADPAELGPTPRAFDFAGEDGFEDEYVTYAPEGKLTKPASQRGADQALGRAPAQGAASNGAWPAAGVQRSLPSPAAGAAASGATAFSAATMPAAPHDGLHAVDGSAGDKPQPDQGVFRPTAYLDEWKQATVGTLSGTLLDLDDVSDKNTMRWEGPQARRRSSSISSRPRKAEAFEGEYDEKRNGTRTPNQQVFYPSIGEVQSGDFSWPSGSEVDVGFPFQPQHLAPRSRRARGRAKRRDGSRPFSPSLSANDSRDSLSCFSLHSNDASMSRHAQSYSCTMTPRSFFPSSFFFSVLPPILVSVLTDCHHWMTNLMCVHSPYSLQATTVPQMWPPPEVLRDSA